MPESLWQWDRLDKLELGQFAEAFTRMQFAMRGWRTYMPLVDNHGVDFLARHRDGREWSVQVKSVRDRTYAYVTKTKVEDPTRTLVALILCDEGEPPRLLLIPVSAWKSPNAFLADRDYVGLKSEPEYGMQPTDKNEELMQSFAPELTLD